MQNIADSKESLCTIPNILCSLRIFEVGIHSCFCIVKYFKYP